MRKTYLAALLAACFLSACGGDGGSDASPAPTPGTTQPSEPTQPGDAAQPPSFARLISFGDSLSDVGTYAVGPIKTLGGGKFTINGDSTALNPALTGQNWTEQLAMRLDLPVPCAAQTGLDGDASNGLSVPVTDHAGCFGYAQGGARVTNPVGVTNKLTGDPFGGLTVPVAAQISRHLELSGGKFQADELVLVMAGGNDLLVELNALEDASEEKAEAVAQEAFADSLAKALAHGATDPAAAAVAIRDAIDSARSSKGSTNEAVIEAAIISAASMPGNAAVANEAVYMPMVAGARNDALAAAMAAANTYILGEKPRLTGVISTAATELVELVKNRIIANGAQYVVVNNLPDVALTPSGRAVDAVTSGLISAMTQAFNERLRTALADEKRVLLVDAYQLSQEAAANPTAFGLTNVTETACDLDSPMNPLKSSLICTASNLKEGDVSRYAYADDEHPTPYFYGVLTNRVVEEMKKKGWL